MLSDVSVEAQKDFIQVSTVPRSPPELTGPLAPEPAGIELQVDDHANRTALRLAPST